MHRFPEPPVHRKTKRPRRPRKVLRRLIENDLIQRVSYDEYRNKVQRVYEGPKGALLTTCSMISLHLPLGERIFRSRKFDLRGARSILDVGSGTGQMDGSNSPPSDQVRRRGSQHNLH